MKGDLAAIQEALARMLRDPVSLVGRAEPEASASAIAAGSARLSPVEQIDVYREQFFLRHLDVLRDDFASMRHLLGDDAFDELARAYLAAHPPSTFSLRDLGHAMAAFVRATRPWADDALLFDLARVEWAFVESFDAPDAPPLDPAAFAGATEESFPRARIDLDPSVRLLSLGHAAHDYRHEVKEGRSPARPAPAPASVVVYRRAHVLKFAPVPPEALSLLAELAAGAALADACERAREASGAAPASFEDNLGGWFSSWTSAGWIARVRF